MSLRETQFAFTMMAILIGKSSIVPTKKETAKPVTVKEAEEPHVSFIGIVNETDNTTIIVERTVKDKTETLEFALDKAFDKIKIGDKVKVNYIKKEDKYIATQVALVVPKRIIKKVTRAKAENKTHIDEASSLKWRFIEQETQL